MNKTITIYELLGLAKDGKAPKKIKYDGDKYTYNDCKGYEIDSSNYNLFETIPATFILNDTVEIIEDNDNLEKINITEDSSGNKFIETGNYKYTIRAVDEYFANKINGIIDHINKIEEKLDER